MSEAAQVPAGDRKACQHVECILPAVVRIAGTAVRGELFIQRLPGKPLAALLMEPADLCRGHAVDVLARTLQQWEV